MSSGNPAAPISKKRLWAGRIISTLVVLFLLFDAVAKLMWIAPVLQAFARLGYPESLVFGIGLLELVCVVLYVIPRTSILGAIILTGYLGGAIAIQLPTGNSLFGEVLFPVYVAVMLWGGIYLRDERLRSLVPLRT